ncbi:putative methylenetetrahydrofolate dehydrogenase-like protein [Trypanosoma grayi]|uniref:putative methylenetetrahydrofolate dehydrogenase-like protein n=1 Tax=Trypanosoma grayi TaxID=71804 RepID=UPI0004F4795D|nr:putative methylenetetrahydrofolate dehydrogenase-like protein [Trypanosoma grayi]KEG10234.1 putative methylenetetrahydrofolate dehydrogenase-like protein [Trypanosoma grayi]
MKADVLSGRCLSNAVLARIKQEMPLLRRPPCLAVVVVGSRPDSMRYIAMKQRVAEKCGIRFQLHQLPVAAPQHQLHHELQCVSGDDSVDGVLLQLPLPPHLRACPALLCIHPSKDVDGLHPLNAGNLFLHENPIYADALHADFAAAGADSLVSRRLVEGRCFIPCTAMAVRALLFSYLAKTTVPAGAALGPRRSLHAVIINTSMVVGIPTAALLQKESNITVTLCSRSNGLDAVREMSRQADILVTALGIPRVVTADFVKSGAIVLDVAINEDTSMDGSGSSSSTISDGSSSAAVGKLPGRRRLCGDVDEASVSTKAAALTPVPGGVGPLTVAYLMQNTLKAYHLAQKKISLFSSFASGHGGRTQSTGSSYTTSVAASGVTSSVLCATGGAELTTGNDSDSGSNSNGGGGGSSVDGVTDESSEDPSDGVGSDSSFGVC